MESKQQNDYQQSNRINFSNSNNWNMNSTNNTELNQLFPEKETEETHSSNEGMQVIQQINHRKNKSP